MILLQPPHHSQGVSPNLQWEADRRLLELDEAVEAVDAAIEYKNELICGRGSELAATSTLLMQVREGAGGLKTQLFSSQSLLKIKRACTIYKLGFILLLYV